MKLLTRITPNFFSVPFGLAGLGIVWRVMAQFDGSPGGVSDALFLAAAVAWLLVAAGTAGRLARSPRAVLEELRDPALSPFWSLMFVVGMLLAIGLQPHAYAAAKDLFVAFLVATGLFGGWVTGQCIAGDLDVHELHPGYFLPTVAGGFIGAEGAAGFGMQGVGWMSFGIAMVCWLMLGALILGRLMFVGMPPAAVLPTLAIELAPPAVGGSAYFALHGTVPDGLAYALAGYAALMILVQLRLTPIYVRLAFAPGFWAFTFPWTAAAVLGLRWLAIERPAGQATLEALVAGAVSVLVAAIAGRSMIAVARGQFIPPSTRLAGSGRLNSRP
jgi:tellurite resistance protein